MPNEDKNVKLASFFGIEIDGIEVASYEDVEISPASKTAVTNRTGTDPDRYHVSQGLHQTQTIKLGKVARDLDDAVLMDFSTWYENGDADLRNGAINYYDRFGNIFHRKTFEDGLLTEFEDPRGDANAEEKAKWMLTITTPRVQSVDA